MSDKLGVAVEEDDRLFEGASRSEVTQLLDELTAADVVVSSHGDVVPILLDLLVQRGMQPDHDLVWQKASTWLVERTADGWGRGRYLPPPDRA